MNHVLIVAYYFPPIAASGAMRPLAFCRHLPTHGWHASVLSTNPESAYPAHPVDVQLETYVPAGMRIERVGYRDPLNYLIGMRERLRKIMKSQSSFPHRADKTSEANVSLQASNNRPGSPIKDAVLDWMFAFPDRQVSWRPAAVRRIMSLKSTMRPDVILATGGPWTNFVVGRTLAQRFQCPLILDYRDPWTSNPYYSFGARFLTEKAKHLERSICSRAAHVIANTDELRQKLCLDYPSIKSKCTAIPNGFDPDILGIGEGSCTNGVPSYTEGYELCHFGTVYGKRSPIKLFQAVWELYEQGLVKPEQVRLRFVGAWDTTESDCNDLAGKLEKQGFLRRECPVSHEVCVRQMKQASVLLVIQPGSPLQVPGKIYEYIAVGRPLLLIGGEGATASLVERYKLGTAWPNEVIPLKKLLLDIASRRTTLDPPSEHQVRQFNYRCLTKTLADVLTASLAHAPVQ